ncbi:hypothetical protein R3W88_024370 [Solanum pinnatisectum]|uniref:Uncharacterized protein n=1 Tax=Solanum pinnatisectum TaxID=50273 RepID=A0AAV9M3Y0_9SOLN|nr:hypothetical protein R3W88_024370 [Solanum pinnatisectum]
MMRDKKKTSIKSSENCEASTYLFRQNFLCLNEENRWRRQCFNYQSDEEEDVLKLFKGFGYPSPTKEYKVQRFSSEESLQNTEHEVETAIEI